MTIDEILTQMGAGAELLTQEFDGKIEFWLRTWTSRGRLDEDVEISDAEAVIAAGYVDQIALEIDTEGTWFRDYAINAAGRAYISHCTACLR